MTTSATLAVTLSILSLSVASAAPGFLSPSRPGVGGPTPMALQANETALRGAGNARALYERARDFALNLASRAEGAGLPDVAASLREAVSSADELYGRAVEAYDEGDFETARSEFREALSTLKAAVAEALRAMGEAGENVTGVRRALAAIVRLKRYISREERILARMAAAGVDVSDPRAALERARGNLSEAVDLCRSGRCSEARESLRQAAGEVRWVAGWIRDHADDFRNSTLGARAQRIIAKVERVKSRLSRLEQRLRDANRTEDAEAVASAIERLSSLEDQFRQAAESGDREGAAAAVREMYRVLRDLRAELRGG